MSPADIRKLLGGYATGTLTEAERNLLFTAALEDQALFDALADEESLRALLSDPAVRGELLAAIDEKSDASKRENWREAPPAAMRQPSTMQAAPMPALPPNASSSGGGIRYGPWLSSWPKGIALAGTLVIAILIVAVVNFQKNRPATAVEVATNEQLPVPPRQALPAERADQTSATPPSIAAPSATANVAKEKPSIEAAPSAGRRDAPAAAPPSSAQMTAGTSASQQPGPQAAASPATANAPAADERERSTESAANAVKDSKESERKAEEKDQQVTVAAEARSVQPARIEPSPPPAVRPSSPARPTIQGLAAGALSKSRFAEPRFTATITDINGTIVSINAGTNAGLKNADTLEIVRDGAVLGTVRLTDTRPTFAVGPLTRSPGGESPRAGDSVRLQAPPAR